MQCLLSCNACCHAVPALMQSMLSCSNSCHAVLTVMQCQGHNKEPSLLCAMPTNGMQQDCSLDNAGNISQDSLAATNIKIINWAPQNDVLGDPAVKVFVTHAGSNSIYEAAYHGKPVVCIPLLADQFDQAAKVNQYITVHCMCVRAGVRSVSKKPCTSKLVYSTTVCCTRPKVYRAQ